MLTGVHLLLTYRCTHECDHCFVQAGPGARGTFGVAGVREVLAQARDVGTVRWIYFEGGEPFLCYPLLLRGLEEARAAGFSTGVVTNAYWAETEEDAALWLAPLAELGVADFVVSDDAFHHGAEGGDTPARRARRAAERLGLPGGSIAIPPPGGGDGLRYRGRAADRLAGRVPGRPADGFPECPDEDLVDPGRVHVDPFGHVHLCQGLVMGNVFERPLARILAEWDPDAHPIAGPLRRGGPAELARAHGIEPDEAGYADACHLCYRVREALRTRHPAALAPPTVYGPDA